MRKINQNSLLVQLKNFGIGPVVGMFISVLTVPVTTRFVAPEEFGKSSLFTLVQTIFNLVVLFGTDQSFIRFYNSENRDKKQLLWHCMLIPIVFCFFMMLVVEIFQKNISIFMFNSYEPVIMWLFLLFLPALLLDRFGLLVIRMDLRGKTYSFLNVLQQVLNFFILLLFLIFYEKSFRSIVFATIISTILNTIIIVINSKLLIPIKVYPIERDLLKEILLFGLPLVPATILSWIMNSFDKIALRSWSSFEELGLYAAAFKIVAILNVFQNIFTTTWTPMAYKWYEEKVPNKKFDEIGSIMIALMTIIFSIIIIFRDIVMLLLGEVYRGTGNIFVFLMFNPVLFTVSEVTSQGIGFSKKTIYSLYLSIIAAVFNVVGNYILVPKYGAQGAAISTCICYIAFFWGRTFFSRRLWFKFGLAKYFLNILILVSFGVNMILWENKLVELCLFLFAILGNGVNLYKIYKNRKKGDNYDTI